MSRGFPWSVSVGVGLALVSFGGLAFAQEAAPAAAPAEPAAVTQSVVVPFGVPTGELDTHLGSGSRARADTSQGDSFDFGPSEGSAQTVRGKAGAPGILLGGTRSSASGVYSVKPGDTLSTISRKAFGQPWQWPKLWSLNPQIQNPHWIYPGDQIRLSGSGTESRATHTLGTGGLVSRAPLVPKNTVFLRASGYIDDPGNHVWGEIIGAKKPVQMMSYGQTVYLEVKPGKSLQLGQKLSIFRRVRDVPRVKGARQPAGQIVAILGSVEVDYWNAQTRIARARITESTDVVERGASIGVIDRSFVVVPPKKAKKDVTSRVITSLYPHTFVGQHQVVFIDRGKVDGLLTGNRLFVIRRGDTWRRGLSTSTEMARTRLRLNAAESLATDPTPLRGNERDFPEEIVAELRVIDVHARSALAVVSHADVEIIPGDRAVAKSGF